MGGFIENRSIKNQTSRMKILLIYKDTFVPPNGYGGTQRKMYWLANELSSRDHDVFLMVHRDSLIFKENPKIKWIRPPESHESIDDVIPDYIDVVHFFRHPNHLSAAANLPTKPYLFTEGCNGKAGVEYCPNTLFVSSLHAKAHGAQQSMYVYGGVDRTAYQYSEDKKPQMLYLALLNWWAKNASSAISLAIDGQITLKLAGGDLLKSPKAWTPDILLSPQKFNKFVHPCGMIDGEIKAKLLRESALLFYIVNWIEPCANAIHESMASGTPAIVSPNGFMAEFITDGENGYVASTYSEALSQLKQHFSKSEEERIEMSKHAYQSTLTVAKMADSFEKFYIKACQEKYFYPPETAKKFAFNPEGMVTDVHKYPQASNFLRAVAKAVRR